MATTFNGDFETLSKRKKLRLPVSLSEILVEIYHVVRYWNLQFNLAPVNKGVKQIDDFEHSNFIA